MRSQTSRAVSLIRAVVLAVALAVTLTGAAGGPAEHRAAPEGVPTSQTQQDPAPVAQQRESPGSEGDPTPQDTERNAGAQKDPDGWTILLYAGLAALAVALVTIVRGSRRRQGRGRPDHR